MLLVCTLLVLTGTTAAPLNRTSGTINLMTTSKLGDFEPGSWGGYTCSFETWTSCVNTSRVDSCNHPQSPCHRCKSELTQQTITCEQSAEGQTVFHFPPGGIY